jgi:hypothetical protein
VLSAQSRVAIFFLIQDTKTGKNTPNFHKIYQMAITYSNGCKIDQIAINIQTSLMARPSKIYPPRFTLFDFWLEIIPSGNPDPQSVLAALVDADA